MLQLRALAERQIDANSADAKTTKDDLLYLLLVGITMIAQKN